MEEKKKRMQCPTSSKYSVILNSLNPKDKIIFDFLENQFNKSGTTKEILYQYIVNNNLQVNTQHIINSCIVNDNQVPINNIVNNNQVPINNVVSNDEMVNDYVSTDNQVVSKYIVNDTKLNTNNATNNKSQPFKIEFDESDNEIAEIGNKEELNPEETALKSLNMWQ